MPEQKTGTKRYFSQRDAGGKAPLGKGIHSNVMSPNVPIDPHLAVCLGQKVLDGAFLRRTLSS
jgi:hypothetical protein